MNLKIVKCILYLSVLCASYSCAASSYKLVTIAKKKMAWRICDERDKPELFQKGFWFISKECKSILFKKKCRPVTHFCKWGDIPCYRSWRLLQKKLR